jgi:hypothetical protein
VREGLKIAVLHLVPLTAKQTQTSHCLSSETAKTWRSVYLHQEIFVTMIITILAPKNYSDKESHKVQR